MDLTKGGSRSVTFERTEEVQEREITVEESPLNVTRGTNFDVEGG